MTEAADEPADLRRPLEIAGLPSLAELDAQDMAELAVPARTATGRTDDDPGLPPSALTHARFLWAASALFGLVAVIYGFAHLGAITDLLRRRLQAGVATDPNNAAPAAQIDGIAAHFPPVMLALAIVLMALSYPLLAMTASRHSRNCRNLYCALCIVTLLGIPIGIDLLFDYPEINLFPRISCWSQFASLALSMLFSVRRSVNVWLPGGFELRRFLRPGDRL